ncbi:MAG: hypothetical protein EBT83_14940, partial [Betaproteobacteria bacterium]|nr:hypothetical protein [Betaproteobacteria bacterium]
MASESREHSAIKKRFIFGLLQSLIAMRSKSCALCRMVFFYIQSSTRAIAPTTQAPMVHNTNA